MKNITSQNVYKRGVTVFHQLGLLVALIVCPSFLFSQEKTVEKANQAYQYKQYAQAASLYESAIAEREEKNGASIATLNLKTKLAYCYRMNNKIDKAEKLYAEIVQDDRAKADTYLYYGETLMCNGKYDEAKKWFRDYLVLEPGDKQATLLMDNCDKVKLIKPYFPYVDIQPFVFNSDADDNAPVAWQEGMVFSSDRKQGVKFMKEKSGWTGRDYLDLYFSAKQADGQYSEPRQFSSKLSEVNKNTGNASFSSDGQEVFFTRNDNELNRSDTYNLQLYRAENNGNNKWKKAEKLPFCSPNTSFMHPAISPDGERLYFASNKKGEGGVDLFVSERTSTGWSSPENLGPTVNTSANEGFPFVDANGRLYFCSKGHAGYGGFDIFFTEQNEDGDWLIPQNLGQPINSPLDDISIFIDRSGKSGMFTSSRGGGDDDIFFFEVLDQPPVDEHIADIVPVSSGKTESFINKKPSATMAIDTPIEKAGVSSEGMAVDSIEIAIPVEKLTIEAVAPDLILNDLPEAKSPAGDAPITKPVDQPATIHTDERFDPFSDVPLEPQNEEDTELGEEEPTSTSSNIFFEMPVEENPSDIGTGQLAEAANKPVNVLFSFQEFKDRAQSRAIESGQIYRLDGATFDPNVWQLTPGISRKLNELVAILRRFPSLQLEISAYTESLGPEALNLELSKNRVAMAVEYMLKEGISADRISGVGYGESQPLNHCRDGVTCSMEEHLYNQRLEVRVIKGIDQ